MQAASGYKKKISKIRWVIGFSIMIPLIAIWLFFLSGRWQVFQIVSASMDPTLMVGDYVLMQGQQHVPDLTGRVIVFDDPKGEPDPLTKRVIAGQFSEVRLRNGQLFVDGSKEPVPGEAIAYRANQSWDVGEDQIFVVGDNRNDSFDSIDFGPIPRSSIKGVVTYRYWPLHRMSVIK